jgi:hypothetical protein
MNTPFPLPAWYRTVATEALEVFEAIDDLPTEGKGRPTGKPLELSPIFSAFLRFRTCFDSEWVAMYDDRGDFLPIDDNRHALDWAENLISELANRWGWMPALLMADHGLRGLQLLGVLAATNPTLTRLDRKAIKATRPRLVNLIVEAATVVPSVASSAQVFTSQPLTYTRAS